MLSYCPFPVTGPWTVINIVLNGMKIVPLQCSCCVVTQRSVSVSSALYKLLYSCSWILLHIVCTHCVARVPGYRSGDAGVDSRPYQMFWEVVGLERGPLIIVKITEELLEWKSSGSGSRKSRLTAVGIRCADHTTPSSQKLAVTSPKSGGRLVDKFACGLKSRSSVLKYYRFTKARCVSITKTSHCVV
jgi:hypothetical protein